MAFTITTIGKGVMGDRAYWEGSVANTGTTGTLTFRRVNKITSYSVTNATTVDKGVKVTASGNILTVTINSSDDFRFIIWGE